MAVDLNLAPHQQTLQQDIHDYFATACPPQVVRDVEASGLGYQPEMWQEMVTRGWLGLAFPEAYGGSGGSFLDLYPLYEEMGRFLVPSPHLDTVAVAGDAILQAGSDALRREVLRAIAGEGAIVSAAILEPNGTYGPAGIAAPASRAGDGFVLHGTKLLVGFAPSARWFLWAARTSSNGSADGVTLFLVDASAPGVSWTPLQNLSGNALFALTFDGVQVPADRVIGEVDHGWSVLSEVTTKAAVLQTVSIVGAAQQVLEITNQYAKDREQFGGPIGRYQAVQYMVTDVLLDLHRTELLVKQAAYRIDAGKPFLREAAIAVAFGKQAAAHLHRQAHEVHAGIAFMLDHDISLYSRRSKFWENNLGDARYYHEQLAQALQI